MKKIRKIDAAQPNPQNHKLRVAAYCRVSTKLEGQKSSIELQKEYYTKLIENNPNWEKAATVCFEKENLTSTDERAALMITSYIALA